LDFYVNPDVLIPRPETEILVHETLNVIKKTRNQTFGKLRSEKNKKTITDVGVGAGAIAVAIKVKAPKADVIGTDISAKALTVARKNARQHQVNILFIKGNLLEPVKNTKLDIIVANLPYLDTKHKNTRPSSETIGLKYEPKQALYAGPDGLDLYRKFFQQLAERKQLPQYVIIEIGDQQAHSLKKIIKQKLPWAKVQVIKDLCGLNRVLKIKL
jgi:release factor glutamine methyltransferase